MIDILAIRKAAPTRTQILTKLGEITRDIDQFVDFTESEKGSRMDLLILFGKSCQLLNDIRNKLDGLIEQRWVK